MELEHRFSVPVPVETAWAVLLDLDQVAPCFPGATLSSYDGDEFAGAVKVKLGPITLLYKGSGKFVERDESARKVIVEAAGKDSRGSGTAAAKVTATLIADGESTDVHVITDLKITGKPAQLSRGLISEVGGRLVQQFADCLARRLGSDDSTAAPAAAPAGGPGGSSAPTAATVDGAAVASAATDGQSGSGVSGAGQGKHASRAPRLAEAPAESEAIDLLGAAGMPVLKRVLPVVAVVALAIIVIAIIRHYS